MEIINEKKSVAATLFWSDIQRIIDYMQAHGKNKPVGTIIKVPEEICFTLLGKYFENLKISLEISKEIVYNGETSPLDGTQYNWVSYEEERTKEPDKALEFPDKLKDISIKIKAFRDLSHDGLELVLVHEINHL